MADLSAISTGDGLIIDESNNDSMHSAASDTENDTENTMVNSAENEPFTEVKSSGKHKASTEKGPGLAEKRAKQQDKFVAYIKGVECNITKRHPKTVQNNILKEFGSDIKIQLAGNSLRLICTSEAQKNKVLTADLLGGDRVVASKPYYESSEGKIVKVKGVISNVDLDMDLAELVDDNADLGLTAALRIYTSAEGQRYPTKTVILQFDGKKDKPEVVSLGYRHFRVRDYIPSPQRCYICQQFGHTKIRCTNAIPRCPRCAGKHQFSECKALPEEAKCIHCSGNHASAYRGCPKYGWVKDSLKTAVQNKMSYAEVFKASREDLKRRIQAAETKTATAAKPAQQTTVSGPASSTPARKQPAADRLDDRSKPVDNIGRDQPAVSPVKTITQHPTDSTQQAGKTTAEVHIEPVRGRLMSTAVRRLNNAEKPKTTAPASTGSEVTITVDRLIALILHLIHTGGGQINSATIQTSIESALQFLGVSIQFGAAKQS